MEDEFTAKALEHVASLETLLGLPSGFFIKLQTEDDWSFTHVGFVIADYVASLPFNDAHKFITEMCFASYNETWPTSGREAQRALVLAEPKIFIWTTALFFLALMSLRIDTQRLEAKLEQAERRKVLEEAEMARRIALGLGEGVSGAAAYRDLLRKRNGGTQPDPTPE